MFRALRCCLTSVGLAILVVAGAVAYFAYVQVARPAPPSPAPAMSTPAPGSDLGTRLTSAEAAIRQNAAAGRHVPVSFTITDAELTAQINQALVQGEVQVPVSNVRVNSVPGQVNISGQAKVAVIAVPFTMRALPGVADGKAQLQVTGVDFGGVAVPAGLAAQLTSVVSSNNLLGDLPLTVTSFRAEQGRLVLEGTT